MRKILAMVLAMLMALSFAGAMAEGSWQNILLLGGDSRNMNKFGRTDSMMIISVNADESLVKMTSIMRDTWVDLDDHGMGKINAANVYGGPEYAMKVVNKTFGTDIEDYVIVNMDDLCQIVDLFGGVEIDVSEKMIDRVNGSVENYLQKIPGMDEYTGTTVIEQAGIQTLSGVQAVAYSRIRKIDSDYQRVMRQQDVLLALAAKAQEMDVDPLMDLAGQVFDIIQTNMERDELENLAKTLMLMETEQIDQFRVPANGTYQDGNINGVWKIVPNLKQNQAKLKEFIYGE